PTPHAGDVLIKVAAAGLNRADILQRQGKYPPPPGASPLPGLEVSGTVVALGAGVQGFREGDAVCALLAGGGYAEYCVAPAEQVLPVPKGVSLADAAALPEACFTVWQTVFMKAALKPGEALLVHGGASGIGTMAIQLAKAYGATVYATAGTAEKCAACEALGAKRAIHYHSEDFVEVIQDDTGGHGADVILDMVGGEYIARNFAAAAQGGRIVMISFLKGAKTEANFAPLLVKRLSLMGSTLRSLSIPEKAIITQSLKSVVWPWVEAGKVRPVIDRRFPLAQAAEAHAYMESGAHTGKILLTL
ncbi:MAG: NAD(P)H-quinone oxidoreductase, partial [Alphaproteobacteria bacterium]|nr:NAD(P)H-quinone oxidoreductase [Alphaproteobacteria bacterium]